MSVMSLFPHECADFGLRGVWSTLSDLSGSCFRLCLNQERHWKTFTSRSILPALVLQRLAEWASLFPFCYFSAIHVQGLVIEASWLQRSEA